MIEKDNYSANDWAVCLFHHWSMMARLLREAWSPLCPLSTSSPEGHQDFLLPLGHSCVLVLTLLVWKDLKPFMLLLPLGQSSRKCDNPLSHIIPMPEKAPHLRPCEWFGFEVSARADIGVHPCHCAKLWANLSAYSPQSFLSNLFLFKSNNQRASPALQAAVSHITLLFLPAARPSLSPLCTSYVI